MILMSMQGGYRGDHKGGAAHRSDHVSVSVAGQPGLAERALVTAAQKTVGGHRDMHTPCGPGIDNACTVRRGAPGQQ